VAVVGRRWYTRPSVITASAVATAFLIGLLLMPGRHRSATAVAIGRPAPTFAAPTVDGGQLQLADFRGHPALVNFWGSWCKPCQDEFPRLAKVHADGVAVVGVLYKDEAGPARSFARQHQATWPSVVDPDAQIAAAYKVTVAPTTFAVDANGIVRARHLGEASAADLAGLLKATRG
jgi:cytochrome c biogenesis protein CcmG/thiol:disulfide interchange protein DsbE